MLRHALLAVMIALTAACALAGAAQAGQVTVFAAASLKNALDAVAARWQGETGHVAAIAYGGSAALARQIEQGAPVAVFVSAAPEWMDVLDEAGRLVPGSRVDLLGNTLVLVAHGANAPPVEIAPGFALAALVGKGKLAMGMTGSVPAGQYGKQALTRLGVWDAVAPAVVQTENVRAALALVARGEAAFGIVYGSDMVAAAAAGEAVALAGTFPPDSHDPIIYPVAMIAGAGATGAAFLQYLTSDAARAEFAAQGFSLLQPPP